MSENKFQKIEAKPDFPGFEKKVLERWKKENTFQKSLSKNEKSGSEYVFYDGPPFPTGNPHHGTIFVSILKDIIPRYKTMRGHYVPRSWGWDCHGLPIETLAEKNLGIKEKKDIEDGIGIKAFNAECRKIVSNFNDSWKDYIDKLGRWVDFDNPYQTLDLSFMESVIWSFSECYKKGLVYKDYRVTPYCYRCETPLSISDTRLDDATRPKQDRTVTVKFKVNELENTYFLAWTTTPWTLPSNLALAVGPEVEYSVIKNGDENLILANSRIASYAKELDAEQEVVETMSGNELVSKNYTYTPPFEYFIGHKNAHRVIIADFVSTEDGTGIVHMAPAFGEDDYWSCRKYNISVVNPVDEKGCFTSEVKDFDGLNVHDANPKIIKFLKEKGLVVKDVTIEHNYPHCWRCRNALIYKAVDAWYFSVEKIKDKLIKNNEGIDWKPDTVKEGRFGNWLKNARDWNISRNRYWATPIPVWICDGCEKQEVLGSLEEIEAKAEAKITDLHKEFLDEITFECGCEKKGTMRRVPEVLDGWYESGSMPYGQFHYPFKNAEHFKAHYPADFIVEYVGQIRGWFYYLHVLATALFDKPAFKNCLVHGTLLAADGKKISKSLKNYTDPMELIDEYGADALRAYMLSSNAVQLVDLAFKDEGVKGMLKSIMLPFWNALSFFTTYAEIDNISKELLEDKKFKPKLTELDNYVLSELEILNRDVTKHLDQYEVNVAMKQFADFLETLNNWYIRRSRKRVWSEDKRDDSKLAFYYTIHTVLTKVAKLLCPFCPFITEVVWERLLNKESVHLEDWPEFDEKLIDNELSINIQTVRDVISAGLSLRAKEKIRVRQPLKSVSIVLNKGVDISNYHNAIKGELNVKEIIYVDDETQIATRSASVNAREIGPKFGKDTQKIIQGLKKGDFSENSDGSFAVAGFSVPGEFVSIQFKPKSGMLVESTEAVVIALDSDITAELINEGYARDLVRYIQDLRKEADLNVADRINLFVDGCDEITNSFEEYISKETLSETLTRTAFENAKASKKIKLAEKDVTIGLSVS